MLLYYTFKIITTVLPQTAKSPVNPHGYRTFHDFGGAYETRTRDPLTASQVRWQPIQ